ncbi:MAG: hypothetical protein OXI87_19500 [Albidovulum sp.]|nr:hypothetical protein [Albidovulum sp.]
MNVPVRAAEGPVIRNTGEWREFVQDFERAGVTAAAYCERCGLKPRKLLRWRPRLVREADPAPAFVSLGPAPADSAAWDTELDLGGGMVVRLRRRNC